MIKLGTFKRVASLQNLKTKAIPKNTSIEDKKKNHIYYICIIKIKLATSNIALPDYLVPTVCQEPMCTAPKELVNRKNAQNQLSVS